MKKFDAQKNGTSFFQGERRQKVSIATGCTLLLFLMFTLMANGGYAQVPTLDYGSAQTYKQGTAITPLVPTASGVASFGYSSTVASSIAIQAPSGIAFDPKGNLFVVSGFSNPSIKELPAGGGAAIPYGPVLQSPFAIAIDAKGNLYVTDLKTKSVYKIPPGGASAKTLLTGLQNPAGIAVDSAGYVYVMEAYNGNVWKLPATGGTAVLFGTYGPYLGGIATDVANNVYLTNQSVNTVIKIPAGGGPATTIATGFRYPRGLVADPAGNIFVFDIDSGFLTMIPAGGGTGIQICSVPDANTFVTLDNYGSLYTNGAFSNYIDKINRTGGYFISPNLPAGLILDENTGIISGTPTVSSPATTYTVTAWNSSGKTSKTISIKITPANSSKFANLSALKLSHGVLSPAFSPTTTSYTATVLNSVRSIQVTPTTPSAVAVVKVNGYVVANGAASAAIPLLVGANTISIVVTAPDGLTTKTYTLTVNRPGNSNDNLLSLKRNVGVISPVFTSAITNYTSLVAHGVTQITITPTATDPDATIKVNGTTVPSGTASPKIPLAVGVNTINIAVTSSDGTATKTYTLKVKRAVSDNANLSDLSASIGPPLYFKPLNYNYSFYVPHESTSITVTPTTAVRVSTVKVNGTPVASGSASNPIALVDGPNAIFVVVTALDGVTIKTYTVTVVRVGAVNDYLSALTTTAGALSPAFSATTANYQAAVTYANSTITVTPTASDPGATITVNGMPVASGSESGGIALSVGNNTVDIKVVASDGSSTMDYYIYVNRHSDTESNPDLSLLGVGSGTLSPAFDPDVLNYTANVADNSNSTNVYFNRTYWNQNVYVNGTAIYAGSNSAQVNLSVGTNTVSVKVYAEDGIANKTYTLTLYRPASTDDNLSSITLYSGQTTITGPSLGFSPSITNYAVNVANADASVVVVPTASNATSTIKVNGATVQSQIASAPIALSVGSNIINIEVTASDGVSIKTYTINVTRAPLNNITTLSAMTISAGTLSPAFSPATTAYTVSEINTANYITLTATSTDPGASITINGFAVVSGTASYDVYLPVGTSTIKIIVKSSDGTAYQTYTLTANRASSNNDNLTAIRLSTGALSPVFKAATTSYTVNVPITVASMTVKGILSDGDATLKINGIIVQSGIASAPIALVSGSNVININVTASDGITSQTYTINVIRPAGTTNDNLSALTTNAGTLSPAFAAGTLNYNISGLSGLTWIEITPTTADPNATIQINGVTMAPGIKSAVVMLSPESVVTNITVVASNGTTSKTYSVITTPAGNDRLSSLTAGAGTLSPVFSPDSTTYTTQVANTVSSETISPTASNPAATVTVNGAPVTSGASSAAIPLAVGSNTINVVVTAPNGLAHKTYTIIENRAPTPSASLSALTLSAGKLSPVFSSSTIIYNEYVAESVSGIRVTPTASDPAASIKVNGVSVSSGHLSGVIPLTDGYNTITIAVTAADGITQTTYTVTVGRGGVPALFFLSIGGVDVKLGSSNYYVVTTTDPTANVAVSAIDNSQKITVNGVPESPSTISPDFPLAFGPNIFTIVVTTPNGAVSRTYTVLVNRIVSNNSALFYLIIDGGVLPLSYFPNISYKASVTNSVSSVNVTAEVDDPNSTMTINGTVVPSAKTVPVALAVGVDTITIIVSAGDGITQTTYTIVVTRAAAPGNIPDASLSVSQQLTSPPIEDDAIVVHQGLSPNGDGINDYLVIDGILAYPDNKLTVMNRNGQLIFEAKSYDNASKIFDGHSSKTGQMQLPGTYFYSLEYTVKGVTKHKMGYLVMKY